MKRERPGVGRHRAPPGRLGQHARVASVATLQGAEGAQPAVLLTDDAMDGDGRHLARGVTKAASAPKMAEVRLHVARPAPDEPVTGSPQPPRVSRPGSYVAGRHHVGVPGKDQPDGPAERRHASVGRLANDLFTG